MIHFKLDFEFKIYKEDNTFNLFFSEVLHQDQECQDHEVIEEEDEAQDEEDVPSLNRTVSANSSSSAHIEYANRGRVSNEIWKIPPIGCPERGPAPETPRRGPDGLGVGAGRG